MKNNETGFIIQLEGDEFFTKFVPNEIHTDYQYLLVSTDIETTGEHKNVMPMKQLIPNGYIMQYFMDDAKKQYKFEYENFLLRDEIRSMITVIMKTVIDNNFKVILMCSEEEKEYGYIKMLRKFIEKEYGFPTYTYKKYCKAREKGEFKEVKNLDKIKKQIQYEVDRINKLSIAIGGENEKLKKAKKQLEKMSKKDMKAFCKGKGYKKYKDLSEKELRKYILKRIEEESAF